MSLPRKFAVARVAIIALVSLLLLTLPPLAEPASVWASTGSPPASEDSAGGILALQTSKEAEPDSSEADSGVPLYRRKSVLAGALALLVGVVAFAVVGHEDRPALSGTALPDFPQPPSTQQ